MLKVLSAYLLLTLMTFAYGLYFNDGNIFVGTFAICKDSCSITCPTGQKCIQFRQNNGNKNIDQLPSLTETCWQIESCAEFPRFYSFQTDNDCQGNCQINIFGGFSLKTQLEDNINLYNAKGYNMICLQYISQKTQMPNICQIAQNRRR